MIESRLFDGLSRRECEEILNAVGPSMKTYRKNEMVAEEGERLDSVGIVSSGRINCTKFYYEGNSHILNVLLPKELLGLETVTTPSSISPMTFLAMEESSILFFPFQALIGEKALAPDKRARLMQNVIQLLANEGIRQLYKAEVLGKKSLRERILTHLCLMRQKFDSDTFTLGMNQEQFSQYLCVNRSALSSQLNKMQKEGLISFRKDEFTINREGINWLDQKLKNK